MALKWGNEGIVSKESGEIEPRRRRLGFSLAWYTHVVHVGRDVKAVKAIFSLFPIFLSSGV